MATLKISDLSVGDWVEYEGLHYPITFVGYGEGGNGSLVNLIRPDLSCFTCKISDIHPIPITPEMLEANGWQRNEEDEYMEYYGDPTSGIAHTKGTYRYQLEAPGVSIVCYFVHKLQHALRLAGVDKEINL